MGKEYKLSGRRLFGDFNMQTTPIAAKQHFIKVKINIFRILNSFIC